ncbi:MAG: bifunctional homocysteine S-methyltransferase/methylenetetrahydrofolate reductase [Oscillospiraceae bacterium]|nr:bifunctional homocysteine S-methyltransferase/methylenetetrahydrofolate reductase [Oscillospiraceae bacterium]
MKIQDYINEGKPFLFDGAMGTLYAARGEGPCEMAALNDPDTILDIHRQYLEAGSRAIKTDTFSLTAALAGPDAESAVTAARAACRLAREAAEPFDALVFADVGPAPDAESFEDLACRQAEMFLEEGVTSFLLETLPSARGVAAFARRLKELCPEAFLLVSFAVSPEGVSGDGFTARELLTETGAVEQVDAVGMNCLCGPAHMLRLVRELPALEKPLSVMPNAGYPTVLGRRTVYQGKPDYFGEVCAEMAGAGAAVLGGCCGTTPAHIAALAERLKRPVPVTAVREEAGGREAEPAAAVNPLKDKLDRGEKVLTVELDPPTDDRVEGFLRNVETLKEAGIDAVTIADNPVGRPRADSSLLACKVKREIGLEPLPHLTCRDRNLNATKALLLGLSMEGIHNVLLVTGDPVPSADRDEVKSVFNFNSRKLARYVTSLNRDVLSVPFTIFGALNLNAVNFRIQLELAAEKEENGVSGFLTQPVLSGTALENLKLAARTLKGKILTGIYPVVSYRNACFMNNEIAGVSVCDEIVELYRDKDREEGEELAVRISGEIAKDAAPYSDGFYLMTPLNRVGLMRRIVETIRPDGKEE